MNDEMTEDQIYATYFDANGQPVRPGVVLSDEESREYEKYFGATSPQTITEESA